MKFPRNARIFRGQLDVAPFAAVFFLLVIFMMVSSLVYTPGVHLELPVAENSVGTDRPTVAVAIDKNGRFYFENRTIEKAELFEQLRDAVAHSTVPLTLVVRADKAVTYEMFVELGMMARRAGIADALLVTLPRAVSAPPSSSAP
jgi:biopolymer transport protein ExbD